MFGRRRKQLANIRNKTDRPSHIGVPESSSECSSSRSMPPRTDRPIIEEAPTRILGPGETPGRDDGTWADSNYYFVQCPHEPQPLEYYYRDLSADYGGPDGTEGGELYNRERMDRLFWEAPGTRYPFSPLHPEMGR